MEELKQKRINGIHQDLFKLTAEMEFRGNGNRINGGESVVGNIYLVVVVQDPSVFVGTFENQNQFQR